MAPSERKGIVGKTLLDKVWDLHRVATLPTGQDQLFIGMHLIHEVTSPQAFSMLKERGLKVRYPNRTFATVDHIVPTDSVCRPFKDPLAEEMLQALERSTDEHGITFFGPESGRQGIVHTIGPELGLTQPGMTIACGDSHTSTHGAFGAIAFGVGTSQIRDILAGQTIAVTKPAIRKINIHGTLADGVYAKDIILGIIARLGVNGGVGYAYEYAGSTIQKLDMEARLSICNMSIEGGARCGYINPDEVTFSYMKGRPYAPGDDKWDRALAYWQSIASDPDAVYDDAVDFTVDGLAPMVSWGINPGQAVGVDEIIPRIESLPEERKDAARKAFAHMKFEEGSPIKGKRIDVAFIGSCTNGRLSDLRTAARVLKGKKVASHVNALVVPGSAQVKREAEKEGLDRIFTEAGFSWRNPGCSMCLAMNPDRLSEDQISASSSNRNFIGRQGSPRGRTLLMSPAMVAAAAVRGEVSDVREMM